MNGPQTEIPKEALDARGHLDQDCNCIGCGYNLRGLDPESVCPECATPIDRSLRGQYLRYSDPRWVEKLAGGMDWILLGFVSTFILGHALVIAYDLNVSTGNPNLDILSESLLILCLQFVFLIGFWRLTAPNPWQAAPDSELTARSVVRWTILASLLLVPPAYVYSYRINLQSMILFAITSLAALVGLMAAFRHAVQLARHLPNESLVRQTRIVMRGILVVAAAGAIAVLCAIWAQRHVMAFTPTVQLAMMGAFLCGIVVLIGGLIFGIWFIVLAIRFRIELHRAARQARAAWMQDPPSSS